MDGTVTKPNAWHHLERVYIQGRHEDLVLVQYVEREPVNGATVGSTRDGGLYEYRSTIPQWAWVADEDVLPFTEFDDAMMAVWKIA
jgi:hypothetical protein